MLFRLLTERIETEENSRPPDNARPGPDGAPRALRRRWKPPLPDCPRAVSKRGVDVGLQFSVRRGLASPNRSARSSTSPPRRAGRSSRLGAEAPGPLTSNCLNHGASARWARCSTSLHDSVRGLEALRGRPSPPPPLKGSRNRARRQRTACRVPDESSAFDPVHAGQGRIARAAKTRGRRSPAARALDHLSSRTPTPVITRAACARRRRRTRTPATPSPPSSSIRGCSR